MFQNEHTLSIRSIDCSIRHTMSTPLCFYTCNVRAYTQEQKHNYMNTLLCIFSVQKGNRHELFL